jgi:hypothetical protein
MTPARKEEPREHDPATGLPAQIVLILQQINLPGWLDNEYRQLSNLDRI